MKVINGNNLDVLKQYPDNYFDAVVTDPPYGLGKEPNATELMKDWIEHGYHEVKGTGFMGKEWDAFVPQPIFWKEVFRVLKHGGHVLAFYGTRTFDWGVMAMRFAGFEVRDTVYWHYGSGFPKSHNISKAIDKLQGAEREVLGTNPNQRTNKPDKDIYEAGIRGKEAFITAPDTDQAKQWDGWGSSLKPASEPIVLARKPLEKGLSIAENVLKWGTGGINIDGCRVNTSDNLAKNYNSIRKSDDEMGERGYKMGFRQGKDSYAEATESTSLGRFPANLIMSHHPECECRGLKKIGSGKEGGYNYKGNKYEVQGFVPNNSPEANSNYGEESIEDWNCHEDCPIRIMDEQSGVTTSGKVKSDKDSYDGKSITGLLRGVSNAQNQHGGSGVASRFFYCAKASKSERNRGLDEFDEKQTIGGGGGIGNYLDDVNSASGKYGSEKAPSKNFHPTVKPVKLMQYLVKMITPPNGKVLDPFCGSGTTGIACKLEGFEFVGIEQDPEYTKIAQARIENYTDEPEEKMTINEETDEENLPNQLSLF